MQEKAGRIIPQTNEEYGYEDHYPMAWQPPVLTRLRFCAEQRGKSIMAGGYQTAGRALAAEQTSGRIQAAAG